MQKVNTLAPSQGQVKEKFAKFNPPRVIAQQNQDSQDTFALVKNEKGKSTYNRLEKQSEHNSKYQPTQQNIELSNKKLKESIDKGTTKVLVAAQKDKLYRDNFQAPQVIAEGKQLYQLAGPASQRSIRYQAIDYNAQAAQFQALKRQLALSQAQLQQKLKTREIDVLVPSKAYTPPVEVDKLAEQFKAPGIIKYKGKEYGLDKKPNENVKYYELTRENEQLKRTTNAIEFSKAQLLQKIAAKEIQISASAKEYQKKYSLAKDFDPPQILRDVNSLQTYTLNSYKPGKKAKYDIQGADPNHEKLALKPDELKQKIWNKEIAVVLPSKSFLARQRKEAELQQTKQTQEKALQQKKEIKVEEKPIHVEPLTAAQKKEVRYALEHNSFVKDKYRANMESEYKVNLNSIPDKVNGQQLSTADKFKMLAGDTTEFKNQSMKIEKDKSISISAKNGVEKATNLNAEFSPGQAKQVQEKVAVRTEMGMKI